MKALIFDEVKIKLYAQIQKNLCTLYKNPSEENIDKLIREIPKKLLDQKDDLMVICELLALFGRLYPKTNKKNAFKLINKIMKPIKKHLSDESPFFWKIFGGNFYFKLWFYEEGLITIEQIVSGASQDLTGTITEIFLPEIIEKVPEIFEKELKYNYKLPYSPEYIEQYKNKRSLHMKWIKESGDYNDQIYSQIETNELRLSIKRDDVVTFEKLLTESDLTVDSLIKEISFENEFIYPSKSSLLDFAISCQSHKIIKYLIKNNADVSNSSPMLAMTTHDKEIINLVKYSSYKMFVKKAVELAIISWNIELFQYTSNNDNSFECFEKLTNGQINEIIELLEKCFRTSNFVFFELVFLPFLKKNQGFIDNYFHHMMVKSFHQMSCFFAKQFLKHKKLIDINCILKNDEGVPYSILAYSIGYENSKAIQLILNFEGININMPAFKSCPAFFLVCKKSIDLKTVDLFCNYPGFDINAKDEDTGIFAFDFAVCNGNFYVTEYILKKFLDVKTTSFDIVLFEAFSKNHFYTSKIALKYFLERDKNLNPVKIFNEMIRYFKDDPDYTEEIFENARQIIVELGYTPLVVPKNNDNSDDSDDDTDDSDDNSDDSDDDSDIDDSTLAGLAFILGLLMS